MRKAQAITKIVAYTLLPMLLVVLSILYGKDIYLLFGNAAEILLIYLIYIKPLGYVFDLKFFQVQLSFRRQMGVATFWLANFHSMMLIYDMGLYDLGQYGGFQNPRFYGLIAIIGMFLLGITSNDLSQRLLKRYWKHIQRLSYFVLIFALIHSSIAAEEYWRFYIFAPLFLILKVLEKRKVKLKLFNKKIHHN